MKENTVGGDPPTSAKRGTIIECAQSNPAAAGVACQALGLDRQHRGYQARRDRSVTAAAKSHLASLADWSSDDLEFVMMADEALTDAEKIWCAANLSMVTTAADVLHVGISDSPELDCEMEIVEVDTGGSRVWTVRDVTTDREQASVWARYHRDWIAQACSAAFEAR